MKETVSNGCKVMALCSQKGGVGADCHPKRPSVPCSAVSV